MVSHINPQRVARRAVIGGRVQGVWFRDSVRRRAESLGVTGWARNRLDGTVEVWAEGQPEAVSALLDYCREGPSRAVVERVAIDEVTSAGLSGFEVR
jgi:acylphosphatase